MLVVLSPAKKLDFASPAEKALPHTRPAMLKSAEDLIDVAKRLNHDELAEMMKISDKLVLENMERYRNFSTPFTTANARQAALMFMGDAYLGLDARSFSAEEHRYAQDHLRILSGLYGLLRPLDLIQPYRLEMGTGLRTPKGKNLYEFWGDQITRELNKAVKRGGSRFLLNCASNEYMKAVNPELLKADIITPVFKQRKDGQARMLGMMAKRARGAMARYAIQNRIENPEDLKDFRVEGYRFQKRLSDSRYYEFHRQA